MKSMKYVYNGAEHKIKTDLSMAELNTLKRIIGEDNIDFSCVNDNEFRKLIKRAHDTRILFDDYLYNMEDIDKDLYEYAALDLIGKFLGHVYNVYTNKLKEGYDKYIK